MKIARVGKSFRVHFLSGSLIILFLFGTPASSTVRLPADPSARPRHVLFPVTLPTSCSRPVGEAWIKRVDQIKWVAYSSPNPDPSQTYYQPSADTMYQELSTLKRAGFTGLITYGVSGNNERQLLAIAQSLDYQGVILGIWNPLSQTELKLAKSVAASPIVLGFGVGNEGLSGSHSRYSVQDLCSAIAELRDNTGKPAATSEDIEAYYRWPQLTSVGDWVFAISHPYWHFTKYAADAIAWEQAQYDAIRERTSQYIFFKEVGLPTAGAAGLSEANQDAYYRGLAETNVRFAYFEGFDQPSKTHASVEPHWGIFRANLSPKLLAWNLMGYHIFTADDPFLSWTEQCKKSDDRVCLTYSTDGLLLVGRDVDGRQYQSVISFDTANLPDDAIITTIKLKVESVGIAGNDPLSRQSRLLVDICQPPEGKTVRYQTADFRQGLSCTDNLGVFSGTPKDGWFTANFSSAAAVVINSAGTTQFRLRIDRPGIEKAGRAYFKFYGGDPDGSNSPILLIKYDLP